MKPKWADPVTLYPLGLYPKINVRLMVTQRKRFVRVTAVPYTLWWRCYRPI